MKILRLLFFATVLSASLGTQAQASLFIQPGSLNQLNGQTYHLGDTTSVSIWIHNNSAVTDSSYTFVYFSVNGVLFTAPDGNVTYSVDSFGIAAHDSLRMTLYFNFNGPDFVAGPSVVVIWPRANGCITADSVITAFTILGPPDSLLIDSTVLGDSLHHRPGYTYHYGDVDSILVPVTNIGSSFFSQPLTFDYSINGVVGIGSDTPTAAIWMLRDTVMIAPLATGYKMVHFNISPVYLPTGPSVVVIWPKAFNTFAVDSSSIVLHILVSGIPPIGAEQLRVYMSAGQLVITSTEVLKECRIYDLQGAVIVQQEISASSVISMAPYADGLYFAEITLADNSRQVYKVYNPPLVR